MVFRTPSPDEIALADFARDNGFVFTHRSTNQLTVRPSLYLLSFFLLHRCISHALHKDTRKHTLSSLSLSIVSTFQILIPQVIEQGVETFYELLCVLEFSSARRRMSVIVKSADGAKSSFPSTSRTPPLLFLTSLPRKLLAARQGR